MGRTAGLSDHGLLADSEAILVLAVDGRGHVLRDGPTDVSHVGSLFGIITLKCHVNKTL